MATAFPEFAHARLLVHIAFHYVEARQPYLRRVLEAISTYPFAKIDVVVDTNSDETGTLLQAIPTRPGMTLRMCVHDTLAHPYDLTWSHREAIHSRLDDYDYFMYLEDDICVSAAALEAWCEDSIALAPLGYLRGFVRVETNSQGEQVCTDYLKRATGRDVLMLAGRRYLRPHNPYQGFWIYSRLQMDTFVASNCWHTGNYHKWEVRERASAGMIWLDAKKHTIVVPLDHDTIAEEAIVLHLPNNYANDPATPFGKIRPNDVLRQCFWDRLASRLR
jgi:hypothetical protein